MAIVKEYHLPTSFSGTSWTLTGLPSPCKLFVFLEYQDLMKVYDFMTNEHKFYFKIEKENGYEIIYLGQTGMYESQQAIIIPGNEITFVSEVNGFFPRSIVVSTIS